MAKISSQKKPKNNGRVYVGGHISAALASKFALLAKENYRNNKSFALEDAVKKLTLESPLFKNERCSSNS